MPEHLADGEQIDTAIDHEGSRAVTQVMDAKARKVRRLDRIGPSVFHIDERLQRIRVRHQPRTVLVARQAFDDVHGRLRQGHMTRLASLTGGDQP